MIRGAKNAHGAVADKAALEGVLEYSRTVSTVVLPHEVGSGQTVNDISNEDGSQRAGRLDQTSTRHAWWLRADKAQLKAAQFATAAAAIDVVSNFVKGVAHARDLAVTYQVLKAMGGGLSAVASGYGAYLDFGEFSKATNYRTVTLYLVRAWFQAVSSTLTVLTAFSYCSPLIETFGKRFGERLAGQALTAAAKRLLFMRAALIFASLEVSIFLITVSLTMWFFEDNALEKWCMRCAFGADRKLLADVYQDADSQLKAYDETLKEVQ